jgi:hypothetical protein
LKCANLRIVSSYLEDKTDKEREVIPHSVNTLNQIEEDMKRRSLGKDANDKFVIIDEGSEETKQPKWLNPNHIVKIKKISKGAFAKVYLGQYQNRSIAIKTLLGDNVTAVQIHSFKSEFEILWFGHLFTIY